VDSETASLEVRAQALSEMVGGARTVNELREGLGRAGALAAVAQTEADVVLIDRAWFAAAGSAVPGKADILWETWQAAFSTLADDPSPDARAPLLVLGNAAAEAFWTESRAASRERVRASFEVLLRELEDVSSGASSRHQAVVELAAAFVEKCHAIGVACTQSSEGAEFVTSTGARVESLLSRIK
jgi:hypothetical protein